MYKSIKIYLFLLCFPIFIFSKPKIKIPKVVRGKETQVVTHENDFVDIKSKIQVTERVIKRALDYFKTHTLEESCREFGHNVKWRVGEVFPFVVDYDGNILVHGTHTTLIWRDIKAIPGLSEGFKQMLNAAEHKGGWVNYPWHNGFKSSYIVKAVKDDINYIIGAGFFPESQEYDTERLVKEAVTLFKQRGSEEAFSKISSLGQFVKGDIYLFAYDLNGNCVAHGDNKALIGQNLINLKDSRGKFLIREFIELAKSKEGKGWVDYYWRNSKKRAYLEKVVDPKTKTPYFIGGGYYPDITLDSVYSFVAKAIRHLKDVGSKQAFADFSNPVGEYIDGGLGIMVFDLEGKDLADGEHPDFVGQNLINLKDPEGKYIVRSIIELVNKDQKGTITYLEKHAYKLVYAELVDVPDGRFIVTAGFYPSSKKQSVISLVDRAIEHLKSKDKADAFKDFRNTEGEFYRGDLYVFVYDPNGTCLVNGIYTDMIWKNFSHHKDENGKRIIDELIALAQSGGGWAAYRSRNADRKVFVKLLEKENKLKRKEQYVVGCGYYL